jgi:RND family efflux transporter MFP subunit
LARLPYLAESSRARLDYARQNVEGKRRAQETIAGRVLQKAESELREAAAEREELQQRRPRLEQQRRALKTKVDALAVQLDLLIEESRRLEDAEARKRAAEAELQASEIAVEKAELALHRTVVRAPIAGRVLKLAAYPGTKVGGLDSTAGHNSGTVVELYRPDMLQVRADVRLEDVPLVQPGQPVEIETASAEKAITGTVLAPTSSANIQKNTLEVKVALDDPPPTIRPEMLVTATFIAPPQASWDGQESENDERLLIPRRLVLSGGGGTSVWIVAADGTARRQAIELGKAGTEELIEVVDGIRPTDKLIASGYQGLEPGTRVTISGEDPALGVDDSRR